MKELNVVNLKEAAKQILIDIPENEYCLLVEKFKKILDQLKNIDDLDSYEPMNFPFFCEVNEFFLRDDVVEKTVERDDFLKNSNYKIAGQIKFPKFNENE